MSGARPGARPAPRVTTVLESLAAQRSSGVLEIDGDPAGVIYLDQGQVTYAQASWVPDLAARFCASQQPPADVRALLLGGNPGRDPGAALLSCVSRAELQALLRSAIVDAIIALTVPVAGSAVSGIRFEAPRAHWASAFARLPLDAVREKAACRGGPAGPLPGQPGQHRVPARHGPGLNGADPGAVGDRQPDRPHLDRPGPGLAQRPGVVRHDRVRRAPDPGRPLHARCRARGQQLTQRGGRGGPGTGSAGTAAPAASRDPPGQRAESGGGPARYRDAPARAAGRG